MGDTPTTTSLLGQDSQGTLFDDSDFARDVISTEERNGVYTGERFFLRDPERYRLVVDLLANGYGRLRIAAILHVNHHTVAAVQRRENLPIAIEKQRLAGLARYGAGLCLEGVVEDLADPERRAAISTRDKGIVAGVLVDKMQLLSGHATSITEHVKSAPAHDDFLAEMARVYELVETDSTGSGDGTDQQKGTDSADSQVSESLIKDARARVNKETEDDASTG